jgi:large subunit ribosomal protein L1
VKITESGEQMKHGKRYREARNRIERGRKYPLEEALDILKDLPTVNFDETVEFSANLGVNPRHADQQVRGTVILPHGTGREIRVLVIAKGEKEVEAKSAGADYVGSDEFVQKINEGWLEFDVAITTPDMMSEVGKLGRILGPRGLMPNPKAGTVTFEVEKAVKDSKAGKIEYRVDKGANIHVPVGRMSFEKKKLSENIRAMFSELLRAKPSSAKGKYLRSIYLSSAMGPSIKIDDSGLLSDFRK